MRIRLKYFDQNERFARAWPDDGVSGTLTRRLALEGWGDDWYILELDRPFCYDGRSHAQMLIRSRWEGHAIGDPDPTSVFILLVPDPSALELSLPAPEAFENVAWGMPHTVAVA